MPEPKLRELPAAGQQGAAALENSLKWLAILLAERQGHQIDKRVWRYITYRDPALADHEPDRNPTWRNRCERCMRQVVVVLYPIDSLGGKNVFGDAIREQCT